MKYLIIINAHKVTNELNSTSIFCFVPNEYKIINTIEWHNKPKKMPITTIVGKYNISFKETFNNIKLKINIATAINEIIYNNLLTTLGLINSVDKHKVIIPEKIETVKVFTVPPFDKVNISLKYVNLSKNKN
jgi:hypothetical protein